MILRLFGLSLMAMLSVTATANAADCPKMDQKYFKGLMTEYSVCLSKASSKDMSLKLKSDPQIAGFFDRQVQCQAYRIKAMDYLSTSVACTGKPLTEQQKTIVSNGLKNDVYRVLIKDLKY